MPKSMQELYQSSEEFRNDAIANELRQRGQTAGEACDDTIGKSISLLSQEELEQAGNEYMLPDRPPLTDAELAEQRARHAHGREMPKIGDILARMNERLHELSPEDFEKLPDYEKGPHT